MSLVVQKYGGSSLATSERIEKIAEHIAATKSGNFNQIVVVVSAMGDTTDELLSMARKISAHAPSREVDMLLTAGERISMSLLAIALDKQGIKSLSLTGSQSGIITDNCHGNAKIQNILGHRIEAALKEAQVVIVAGFQGMSLPEKEITTLGRGGSDLTAIALADRLNAQACQIYKDVDGICSADPRLVDQTQVIQRLSWASLSRLTWSGSGVIHSRGAHLAEKRKIPLEIRSSFNFGKRGTTVEGSVSLESPRVDALAHLDELAWVSVKSQDHKLQSHINQWLWTQGSSPLIQQLSMRESSYQYLFSLEMSLVHSLKDFAENSGMELEVQEDKLAAISIVGEGFKQDPSMLSKIHETLKEHRLVYLECHNHQLIVFIESSKLAEIIHELHSTFITHRADS